MPHDRPRHLSTLLDKSLRFWPVICLVGPRQTGKSTLVKSKKSYSYSTLDDPSTLRLVTADPTSLLSPPCSIDEAQKSPALFDAVKASVDADKRPGKFILTGSVKFSSRTMIRESLTGRAKTLRLFPLTLSETLALDFQDHWLTDFDKVRIKRVELQRYLSRGGMPAIFAARSAAETRAYWTTLIDSYVHRDLLIALPREPKPALALAILQGVAEILALGEAPHFARILRRVGGTRQRLTRHLQALEDMMILQRVSHWAASSTKDAYLPFDPGLLLTLLGIENPCHDLAVHEACLQITLMNEILAHAQAADRPLELKYATSPSGERVHFITQDRRNKPVLWKISEEAVPHHYTLRFLRALATKIGGTPRILSPTDRRFMLAKTIKVAPWESVF